MSDLSTAQQQLEEAIERLEQALASRVPGEAAEDAALAHALEEARTEQQRLRDVTTTVSTRLDAAIARLKTALDDDETDG